MRMNDLNILISVLEDIRVELISVLESIHVELISVGEVLEKQEESGG